MQPVLPCLPDMDINTPTPPSGPVSSSPASVSANSTAARNWCMWCHLSALSGLIVPFGNILGPLIIWQIKKAEFPELEWHGKEALNFQISVLIYLLCGAVLAFIGMFFCVGWLLIPVLMAISFASLIFSVIAGIKANDGQAYRYPLTIRFLS